MTVKGSVLTIAAMAIAMMVGATSAQAASCGGGIGDTDNFTTSTNCGIFAVANPGGNPNASDLNAATAFGLTGWLDLGGSELETTNGNDSLSNLAFSFTSNATNTSGTWSLLDGKSFDPTKAYAFALKGATNHIVYLMNTAISMGTWSNADIPAQGRGGAPGLSNVRLMGTGQLINTPQPIPLPAAAWLLLAGLGGLVVLRRRAP